MSLERVCVKQMFERCLSLFSFVSLSSPCYCQVATAQECEADVNALYCFVRTAFCTLRNMLRRLDACVLALGTSGFRFMSSLPAMVQSAMVPILKAVCLQWPVKDRHHIAGTVSRCPPGT